MKAYSKIILALIVSIGTYFFLYWIFLSQIAGNDNISIPISLFLSLVLGIVVYFILGKISVGPGIYLFFGGFIIGSLSFVLGYLGHGVLKQGPFQGQFLGLYITGPIGFMMGLIAGGLYWLHKMKNKSDKPT